MTVSILKALGMGHSAQAILNFMLKKFPQYKEKVDFALASGYTAEQVLKYLEGGNKLVNQQSQSELTEHEKNIKARDSHLSNVKKATLGALGTAAGLGLGALGAGAGTIIPEVLSAEQNQRGLPAPGNQVGISQMPTAPIEQAQTPVQPVAPIPETKQPNLRMPADILWEKAQKGDIKIDDKKDDFLLAVKGIRKKGGLQTKEQFDDFFNRYVKEKGQGKYQGPALTNYLMNMFEENYGEQKPVETSKAEIVTQQSEEPLTQGSLALLPQGDLGEIESVKQGIAKVNADGQERHKKVEDLVPIPMARGDLADLYEQLTQATPEHLRSSVINFAGYDANANELAFRPHGGALYIYKDIPPEFAEMLKNQMFKAKTTGENFYGSWAEGEGSHFSGLGKLIRDLQKQYGGKGKEYIRKYETLVDFLGAAEAAKKEKKKKEMDEKRKRKKQHS